VSASLLRGTRPSVLLGVARAHFGLSRGILYIHQLLEKRGSRGDPENLEVRPNLYAHWPLDPDGFGSPL